MKSFIRKKTKISLDITHPQIAKEWHPTKNSNLLLSNITYGSGKHAWWLCENNHEYKSRISSRTLTKNGCPHCSNNAKMTIEYFVDKAAKVHTSGKYDYSQITVFDGKKPVPIICCIHGLFRQNPSAHLSGKGCRACAKNEPYTTETYTTKALVVHDNYYTYSKLIFTTIYGNVIITCPVHGDFEQTAHNHLQGHGCFKCAHASKITNEIFDKRLLLVNKDIIRIDDYIDMVHKISFKHLSCGNIWKAQPTNLLYQNNSCPDCCAGKNEKIVAKTLDELGISYIRNYRLKIDPTKRNKLIDFYISDANLFIEYNGEQHYRPVKFGSSTIERAEKQFTIQQERDKTLRKYCKDNKIKLLEIDGRKYRNNNLKEFVIEYFANNLDK